MTKMRCKCGKHELIKQPRQNWSSFVKFLGRGKAETHSIDACVLNERKSDLAYAAESRFPSLLSFTRLA